MALRGAVVHPSGTASRRVSPLRRGSGFTLIELIVALVVFGVLVALAVPAYTEFVRNSRRAGVLNEFVAALNLARSEAVKRSVPVAVCRTADGTSCGGSWTQGWLVFVNLDDDSPAAVDAGEPRLRAYLASNPAYTLTPIANFTNFVAYLPNGSANTFGRFTYCDARGVRSARAVFINSTGRPRLSQDTDGDGIHETAEGDDLECG